MKLFTRSRTAKFLSLLLIAVLLVGMAPEVSARTYSGQCGENVTWSFDRETETLTISGTGDMYDNLYSAEWHYLDSVKTIIVEDGVTSIGDYAFEDTTPLYVPFDSLVNVIIGNSVTSIGYKAFEGAPLVSVVIPDSVTSIDSMAFYYCNFLQSVTIPDSVTTLGYHAFAWCTNLTSVNIGSGLTSIGQGTFQNCFDLTTITIPDSVTELGVGAFTGCTSLSSVTFGGGIASIGGSAFDACDNLTDVYYAGSSEDWNRIAISENNEPLLSATKHFDFIHQYTPAVTYPTCTEPGFTIYTCSCGDSYIGDNIPALGHDFVNGTCSRCGYEENLVPEGLEYEIMSSSNGEYVEVTGYSGSSGELTIPASIEGLPVTGIRSYAFYENATLTGVIIPDSVRIIGSCVFYHCANLAAVAIGNGVTSIPVSAFFNCDSITLVSIPDSVVTIGDSAFNSCNGIISVTIGTGVKTIGSAAFHGCDALTDVYYGGKEAQWSGIRINPSFNDALLSAIIHFESNQEHSHSYTPSGISSTCTESGYTTYICACGDSYIADETPALGHDYVNGTCTRCGEADPDYREPVVNPFNDVPAGIWYEDSVLWAVEQGITAGTGNGQFSPNATCTRAQVVTFLWRAVGEPEPQSGENPFTDVSAGDYFYKPVLWALENGITAGTSATTFAPSDPCTRGQVVTFLWRAMEQPDPTSEENPFEDVPNSAYYYQPVLWALENGVTSGTSATTFAPSDPCTRGQVVTFLYRAMK